MSKSILDRYHDPAITTMTSDERRKWLRRISDDYGVNGSKSDIQWFGQPHVIAQIEPFLKGGKPFPHTLLLSEPGLGKTHLAEWIAAQRGELFEEVMAPTESEKLPLAGVVLIDEIHLQRKPEPLFNAMKEQTPTIIGASTRPDVIDKAFRSRFFLELYLHRYTPDEMKELIEAELDTTEEMLDILSTAAAGNPRQAKRLAEVARRLETDEPAKVLAACQITADGLTDLHMRYLKALRNAHRPMGLTQLATILYADETTLRGLEPLLLDYGLIDLSSSGRSLTRKGTAYAKGL